MTQVLRLRLGDCMDVLRSMEEASVGAIICDPPYGLEFMGKGWDAPWKYGFTEMDFKGFRSLPSFSSSRNPICVNCRKHKRGSTRHKTCQCDIPEFDDVAHRISDMQAFQEWCRGWLVECRRVLVPGGVVKSFSGTRTKHRLAAAMEEAGLRVISQEAWVYGSGFPKSLDTSKAVDAHMRHGKSDPRYLSETESQRPVIGHVRRVVSTGRLAGEGETSDGVKANRNRWLNHETQAIPVTMALTEEARRFEGYGTALKPSWEPVVIGLKA